MTTTRIAAAHLDSQAMPHAQAIQLGRHQLVADEPHTSGGGDIGPTPYQLLLAALAACTSITLRMYADRKGWELGPVHIDVAFARDGDAERIERTIRLAPSLTAEQRARLGEIADKTPVTRTLQRALAIHTTLT